MPSFTPILLTRPSLLTITLLLLTLFITVYHNPPELPPYHPSSLLTHPHPPQHQNPINNSTLGFTAILPLTLLTRTDHHDLLTLAAALTSLTLHPIAGVNGSTIPFRALPPLHDPTLKPGQIGAWRAHLNALTHVITTNAPSALILEDDVDWDVRIRSQMQDLAVAVTAMETQQQQRQQPEAPTTLSWADARALSRQHRQTAEMKTPYGSSWDVLWFGHCGMSLPPNTSSPTFSMVVKNGTDATVPVKKHFRAWNSRAQDNYHPLKDYPDHSRVYVRGMGTGVCSLAYAVSQKGARKLLLRLGVERLDAPWDVMLGNFCGESGVGVEEEKDGGEGGGPYRGVCYGVLPQLMDHYRPRGEVGRESDIEDLGGGWREKGEGVNVRVGVKGNLGPLVEGEGGVRVGVGKDGAEREVVWGALVDAWPDDEAEGCGF